MWRLALFFSLLTGCTAADSPEQLEAYLTGHGKGMYWDVVSATDEQGRYLRSINKHNEFIGTWLIQPQGRAYVLFNVDSVHAVHMRLITQDLFYDDLYRIEHNRFLFMEDTFAVDYAARGYILLSNIQHPKAKYMLVRSSRQNRTIGTEYPF